jgi:hypothetical protein
MGQPFATLATFAVFARNYAWHLNLSSIKAGSRKARQEGAKTAKLKISVDHLL